MKPPWLRSGLTLGCMAVLACVGPGPSQSDTFRSRLGFELDLEPGWKHVDPDASEYALLGHPNLEGVDPRFLRTMVEQLNAGAFELLIRTPVGSMAQNVAIRARTVALPTRLSTLLDICEALPRDLEPKFGRRLPPPSCEYRTVAGLRATYIEIEGAIAGTTNLQYQIQRTPDVVVAITATAIDSQVDVIRREFEAMVRSIRGLDAAQ